MSAYTARAIAAVYCDPLSLSSVCGIPYNVLYWSTNSSAAVTAVFSPSRTAYTATCEVSRHMNTCMYMFPPLDTGNGPKQSVATVWNG